LRKASHWLTIPTKRSDGAAALAQFAEQLALFRELPFEKELKAAESAAIEASGGRQDELAQTIDSLRVQWAKSWADGDASSLAGRKLLAIARLGALMRDLAEMQKRGN